MEHWTSGHGHVFTGISGRTCDECGAPAFALVLSCGTPVILCAEHYRNGGTR